MKTLKITLHATAIGYLQYDCLLEVPDNADPDDFVYLLHEAVDGGNFVENGGDWRCEGEEWSLADECADHLLPRWRYVSGEEPIMEQVL